MVPFGMWVSFFIGVVLGNSYHTKLSLIQISIEPWRKFDRNTEALACLFWAMNVVLPPKLSSEEQTLRQ
eukprot:g17833.t1